MKEDHPLGASTPYAASKAACDLIVESYGKTFGNEYVIIRPFNNYGPRQNQGTYAGIVPLTIQRILNNENPVVNGSGEQTRDYLYVTDTIKAAIMAYENEETRGKIINIGSGQEIKIIDLLESIAIK